ncbi:predicted protein [Chaetomium globosum CBS 148.51]|uniref:Uncharacterized protein n=1 Tax=Chaetomium globosum (strain ATCC 6205 / CBS 148.51 / DSM 1962 / NBRC 6347 / NRRL 1970) TaxID=306901 RepID=Q2GWX5_CHAGB|nr:uncharacterized protein CHGG_07529 [Chaetomium globosum CBS 148.51]EAQ86276.1 predicted protein [Chaetomium globosum CBS 148.51]
MSRSNSAKTAGLWAREPDNSPELSTRSPATECREPKLKKAVEDGMACIETPYDAKEPQEGPRCFAECQRPHLRG